jgi:4-nitrophenyl phosphatase
LKSLLDIQYWLIDMDGVLYHGEKRMPGAAELIAALQAEGTPFLLVTNNSTLTPQQYVEKVGRMGIVVQLKDVLTSSVATAEYIARTAGPGTPVHMIGETGLRSALLDRGFKLVDRGGDYVVVGMNRQLTFDTIKYAALAIRAGATFVGTNPDRTLPVEEGLIPGNGAYLAALEAATDVKPFVIGKPEPALLEIGMERLGAVREHTAILGDRVETDIVGGERVGINTVLTLSGVSTQADLDASGLHPDWVVQNVVELVEKWRRRGDPA